MTDAPHSAGLVALADRIELWPIDRLRPYERNPRTHNEAQVDQIAASMVGRLAQAEAGGSMESPIARHIKQKRRSETKTYDLTSGLLY